MVILYIILLLAFLIPGILILHKIHRRKKRLQHYNSHFPVVWIDVLKNNFPLYKQLPTELQDQLHGHINVFLAEKAFYGCDDLIITDEIRVTIAAQACLLLLNRETDYYPNFKTILVYPAKFTSIETRYDGYVEVRKRTIRLGESWHRGPVIISWDDAMAGARDPNDGENVVIHEFAHKLDEENPGYPGLPLLRKNSHYKSWAKVMSLEFDKLQARYEHGYRDLISQYGSTSPAEFFAVISELFFECPLALQKKHPELYNELANFYQLNPEEWHNTRPNT